MLINSIERHGYFPYLVESYVVKLLLETSLVGLFLFLFFMVCVILILYQVHHWVRDIELKWIAMSIFVYVCIYMLYSTVALPLEHPSTAIYFWFLIGIAFKLPHLDKELRS